MSNPAQVQDSPAQTQNAAVSTQGAFSTQGVPAHTEDVPEHMRNAPAYTQDTNPDAPQPEAQKPERPLSAKEKLAKETADRQEELRKEAEALKKKRDDAEERIDNKFPDSPRRGEIYPSHSIEAAVTSQAWADLKTLLGSEEATDDVRALFGRHKAAPGPAAKPDSSQV